MPQAPHTPDPKTAPFLELWQACSEGDWDDRIDLISRNPWVAKVAVLAGPALALLVLFLLPYASPRAWLYLLELDLMLWAMGLWGLWSLLCFRLGKDPLETFGTPWLGRVFLGALLAVMGAILVSGFISVYRSFQQMQDTDPSQRFADFWILGPLLLVAIPILVYIWWHFRRGIRALHAAAGAAGPEACFELGQLLLNGEGDCPKDAASARLWIRRAAQGDHAEAALQLARMLHSGLGGPKHLKECEVWLKRAQSLGHPEAARLLAQLKPEEEAPLPVRGTVEQGSPGT
jgi:hypothetical protein